MILLARHCAPQIEPGVPPREWRLSETGRQQCASLAESLKRHAPSWIVSSAASKARETADALGRALGIEVAVREGLHEQDRSGVPFARDPGGVRARIRELFAQPAQPVFGRESADAARARFSVALERALRDAPSSPIVVVAHGTVISLLVAGANGLDGFAFWESLEPGDYVVLTTPWLQLSEVVHLAAPSA